MAGETEVASEFELALIEVLSDAGCLERSLTAAAKEARNTGHRTEADALSKAVEELAIKAQDVALAMMDSAQITDAKHFAWANDPDGKTARELSLARGAVRSLQAHLERVAKFAEKEAPVQAQRTEAKEREEKAEAEKSAVARALAKAREAGAAKAAAAAAATPTKATTPAAPTAAPAAAAKADAPAAAKAAPAATTAAPAAPAKAAPAATAKPTPPVAKATPKK